MELSPKLQIASIALMGTVLVAITMNTCATSRLEEQVIATRKAVQERGSLGGGTTVVPAGDRAGGGCQAPGTSTGLRAAGWGGKVADINYVEGCQDGAPTSLATKPRPQNDSYVNRRTAAPGTLNYYATSEGDAGTITGYTLGRLIDLDPDHPPAVRPGLATSWEIAPDHLTYTYHLRHGVQFADGRPFTSADVAFSFAVLRDPAVNADNIRSDFDDVVELDTPDAYTVVVRYRQPYWKGLYTVGYTLRVLNKAWYEEEIPVWAKKLGVDHFTVTPGQPGFGEVFNKIRVPPPGTGPYYYPGTEYEPKDGVELVQNPFFWGIEVNPDGYNFNKIQYVFISDPVAAFEAFRKQQFDVTVVDFQEWDDEYSKDKTITDIANYMEYDHTGLGWSYIVWNDREPPFDDPRVRRAMAHLTDREWILKEIERGRGQIAVCPSKPSYPNYATDLKPLAFDVEEARRLLAEAGWTDSDGDGVLDKDGRRFEFELKVGSTRRFYTQVSASLKDALSKVGIRMTLRTLEWATFAQDLDNRRFQAVVLYNSPPDPWVDSFGDWHSSQDIPNAGNIAGWHNAEADALLEKMRTEFDEDARDEEYKQFCRIFQQDQPATLLMHGLVGVLANKRLEDAKVRPTGLRDFDMWVKPENVLHK